MKRLALILSLAVLAAAGACSRSVTEPGAAPRGGGPSLNTEAKTDSTKVQSTTTSGDSTGTNRGGGWGSGGN